MVKVLYANGIHNQEFVRATGYEIDNESGLIIITNSSGEAVALLNKRDVTSIEFI